MLEVKIEELTKAVIALTELIGKIEAGKTVEPVKTIADITRESLDIVEKGLAEARGPMQEIRKQKKAAVDAIFEASAPVVEAAPVMPAAPTFEPVVEAAGKAPFTDGKGLIDYVMTAYKEMGAEKGAKIQGVLTEMGLQNVNELRPTEYDAFYTKVEALK